MKVILLAPTPPPSGGIAGWTVRMKNASLKNGWEVEVVDEKVIGDREVFGDKNKKKVFTEIKRTLNIWKNLIRALRDKESKVVHSCIPAGITGMLREYVCAIITKIRGRKFIIHYRCTLPNIVKSKLELLIFRLLTDISDLVIVLNNPSVDFVKNHSKTDVVLIPNFVEKSAIINENERIIAQKVQRIVYVGGVIESKGCCDIIKVAEKFPEVQFCFVGNPDQKIIDMEKPPNVILLGEKNNIEVKKELEKADIFMFLTYFHGEGFSNALAEAMANGLPCIVTDWAANKDMIEEYGGIVVPIKDHKAAVDALNRMSSDVKLRKKQSSWNINKVKDYYSDEVITNMYVDSYESLLK